MSKVIHHNDVVIKTESDIHITSNIVLSEGMKKRSHLCYFFLKNQTNQKASFSDPIKEEILDQVEPDNDGNIADNLTVNHNSNFDEENDGGNFKCCRKSFYSKVDMKNHLAEVHNVHGHATLSFETAKKARVEPRKNLKDKKSIGKKDDCCYYDEYNDSGRGHKPRKTTYYRNSRKTELKCPYPGILI